MIKLQDVARHAGVSMATASLVMNNRPGVNDNTRTRVLEAAERLGYSPNNRARGLVLRKTNTIGLIVTDIENPFFGSTTRYINECARNAGHNLILSVSNDDLVMEDQIIETFISERVEGVIIVPTLYPKKDSLPFKHLEKHQIPYIFITSFYPGISCDCVMTDLEAGSYTLCTYLLSLGHRRIFMLVSSDRNAVPSSARIEGCRRAFREQGLQFPDQWVLECARTDFRSGFDTTTRAVTREKPDAIIAINDIMALGAKRALKELGYNIPRDISVAGYDDVVFSSISEIPLTTVRQDVPAMCEKAVDILVDRIKRKRRSARLYTVEPELVIRGSTGPCAGTPEKNTARRSMHYDA